MKKSALVPTRSNRQEQTIRPGALELLDRLSVPSVTGARAFCCSIQLTRTRRYEPAQSCEGHSLTIRNETAVPSLEQLWFSRLLIRRPQLNTLLDPLVNGRNKKND